MKDIQAIRNKIFIHSKKKLTKVNYFELISELSEKIIDFDIKIESTSICYKVLKKASENLLLEDIFKTNPKLRLKCFCIANCFERLNFNKYTIESLDYSTYELSLKEYIILTKLDILNYDITFDKSLYDISDLKHSLLFPELLALKPLSENESLEIFKKYNQQIVDPNQFFIFLIVKEGKEFTDKHMISRLNIVNLILLENLLV